MSWNKLRPNIPTLEADTVNKVYENIDYIRQEMRNKGYTINDIILRTTFTSTQIVDVKEILQTVEDDLSILNETDYISKYYGEHYEIDRYFTKSDYQRWILILNEIYDMISGRKKKWKYLILKDNNYAIDIEQNYIIIRSD